MPTRTARELRIARELGHPEFTRTPTTVASSGLVIPPIRRSGAHQWRLECEWSLRAGPGTLTVPEGRETDLADVPPVLRPRINDFEFGITGPLVHDFIYEHAGRLEPPACHPVRAFTRGEADNLLWTLMVAEGVPWWRRVLAHVSARLGGHGHWRGRIAGDGVLRHHGRGAALGTDAVPRNSHGDPPSGRCPDYP